MSRKVSPLREGACRRYAMSDKSDPFAFSRAMAHTRNGIAGYNEDGSDAFYDAQPEKETRHTPDGEEYEITVYRSAKRP